MVASAEKRGHEVQAQWKLRQRGREANALLRRAEQAPRADGGSGGGVAATIIEKKDEAPQLGQREVRVARL